jgi:hypothetical protein
MIITILIYLCVLVVLVGILKMIVTFFKGNIILIGIIVIAILYFKFGGSFNHHKVKTQKQIKKTELSVFEKIKKLGEI